MNILRYLQAHNHWISQVDVDFPLIESVKILKSAGIKVDQKGDRYRLACLCTFTETTAQINPACIAHSAELKVV